MMETYPDYPMTWVSLFDAQACAAHFGKTLPSRAQWALAAFQPPPAAAIDLEAYVGTYGTLAVTHENGQLVVRSGTIILSLNITGMTMGEQQASLCPRLEIAGRSALGRLGAAR